MDRRCFLKALLATAVAPLVPMIPESALAEDVDYEKILSGEIPIYLGLCGDDGMIPGIKPKQFINGANLSFSIDAACVVTHAAILTADHKMVAPLFFRGGVCHLMRGDTFNVLDVRYLGG